MSISEGGGEVATCSICYTRGGRTDLAYIVQLLFKGVLVSISAY